MPTLNDVLAGSQAQAVQVQQIIDALKGTPNKGVPVALVSLNDPNNYALTVQNDDPVNSRALSVLKADGTTLISADATGVTLGSPVNLSAGSVPGAGLANGSVTNAKLGPDVARANLLVNGGMAVQQRGPGGFTANNAYTADRWQISLAGASTISAAPATGGAGPGGATVPVLSGAFVWSADSQLVQIVRFGTDGNAGLLRGSAVSFSARVYANTASAVRLRIASDGTGALNALSSFHVGNSAYATLTVANQQVPVDATYIQVGLYFSASCSVWGFTNAMLVVGSQPADYVPMHPADDLARCLRYYEKPGATNNTVVTGGIATAASQRAWITLPWVAKAVTPTVTIVGAWAQTNCSKIASYVGGLDRGTFYADSLAAGVFNSLNATANSDYITIEANA